MALSSRLLLHRHMCCLLHRLMLLQVLQLAACNVPDGILAARSGSKAVTAAIDTLQVRRCESLSERIIYALL
jgi:hypothetical protein